MEFRESKLTDIPVLIELSRSFDTSPYSFDKNIFRITNSTYPAFAKDMLSSTSAVSIIAEDKDKAVGYITFSINHPLSQTLGKSIGSILLLAVQENYRGRGIGKSLVKKALASLLLKGAGLITVGTDIYNYPAIHIYEDCGFHLRMGWHIFRHYFKHESHMKHQSEKIKPLNLNDIDLFLNEIIRPISIQKERGIDNKKLKEYLSENARRSLLKGKTEGYVYEMNGKPAGFIHIGKDEIGKKTIQTDKQVYKILDLIALKKFKETWIETELLNDIKFRLKDYCLLELWMDAENSTLIHAAEDAGYHLSYTGLAFHYIK